ncbi:hypothetical protein ACKVEX_08855 [Rhodocyclaceae bacterium SMB388]
MKSHHSDNILPSQPRFHLRQTNGIYLPMPFVFVTERMHQDILVERKTILDALPPADRVRQQKAFERYDPKTSARAFQDILSLFGVPGSR